MDQASTLILLFLMQRRVVEGLAMTEVRCWHFVRSAGVLKLWRPPTG